MKVWRYALHDERTSNQARITLLQERLSHGEITVVSSWGNYAYAWWGTGKEDFRDFILAMRRDTDYLFGKLGGRNVFDGELTEREIKRRILEARRSREIDNETARDEWDICGAFDSVDDWKEWLERTFYFQPCPYELYFTRPDPAVWQLCEWLLPRLAAAIEREKQQETEACAAT
jgi:hypothetical protein